MENGYGLEVNSKIMDETDKRIVEELKVNAKITMKELGEKVHLTGQAASTRVIKLEESGVIKGYTADINYSLYGYPVHAMINVYTKDGVHEPYLKFVKGKKEYVVHNYKISGDSCYLLECHFPDNEAMDAFLVQLSSYVGYKLSLIIRDALE